MLNIIDAHNHCSEFSPDASQPLANRLVEAEALGLGGLVITDHFDKRINETIYQEDFQVIDLEPLQGEWTFHFPTYMNRMTQEQARIAQENKAFKLLIGVELGYHPALAKAFKQCVEYYAQLDSIIGSVHNLRYKGFSSIRELYKRGKTFAYALYLEALAEMVEDMPFINVLGHFDYIARYNHFTDKKLLYKDFPDAFDHLFHKIIERDIALEINTSSQRQRDEDGKPLGLIDDEILSRYMELGGDKIVLSSDAHHEGKVGLDFYENVMQLEALGCTQLTYFEKRKPYFTQINT